MLPAKRKAFRAGNQLGKTYAGLRWIIDLAAGRHPTQFRPPPLECWIVCTSWSQSVAIMTKFRTLCEDSLINHKASSRFNTRNAYGKDNPAVIFHNGSVVRFRTTNQGPVALQGASIMAVLCDEPTSVEIYRELDRRLLRTGGHMGLTFTPVNRDCRWIRQFIEEGHITEVHARLTPENLTPIGADAPLKLDDGTVMSQAWVDSEWARTPDLFAAQILDGEWEGKPIGQFFKPFARSLHARPDRTLSPARGPIRLCLGLDHAAAGREYGQAAVLVQVQQYQTGDGRTREALNVLDEVVMVGSASSQQFGQEIANMLRRRGVAWRDLHEAHGDIPAASRIAWKSNGEVERAVARAFGMDVAGMRPRIKNAKEGKRAAGLLDSGCRYLYESLVDALINCHPRCERLIEAFEVWDYDPKHSHKDILDSLRYALKSYILPRYTNVNRTVRIG